MSAGRKEPAPNEVHSIWKFLDRPISLVSTSPRRAEILRNLDVPFEQVPPELNDENGGNRDRPDLLVRELAEKKVGSVARSGGERLLLGADTVVVTGGVILEKPIDSGEATAMLERLSGRTHHVLTGLHLLDEKSGHNGGVVEKTSVTFRSLEPGEIDGYVRSGEPFDKAGGYGIQGLAGLFVSRIEGCYFNVVGLPVTALGELLRRIYRIV